MEIAIAFFLLVYYSENHVIGVRQYAIEQALIDAKYQSINL